MTDYRRARRPGATHFFTVNLADRDSSLLVERIEDLRAAVRYTRARHHFSIDAMCVLPEHIHAVWTLPEDDSDFSLRWRLIKTFFTCRVPDGEPRSVSRVAKHERGVWQRRYWEHLIRDASALQRHVDYTHLNPVRHGHVDRTVDWPHWTFHREVRAGRMSVDWGCALDRLFPAGERE